MKGPRDNPPPPQAFLDWLSDEMADWQRRENRSYMTAAAEAGISAKVWENYVKKKARRPDSQVLVRVALVLELDIREIADRSEGAYELSDLVSIAGRVLSDLEVQDSQRQEKRQAWLRSQTNGRRGGASGRSARRSGGPLRPQLWLDGPWHGPEQR